MTVFTTYLTAAATLLASVAVVTPPSAQAAEVEVGALVLATWEDGNLYPARVASVTADGAKKQTGNLRYKVAFYDGAVSLVTKARIYSFTWKVGSRVECNWRGGKTYYKGRIAAVDGEAIFIHYDDGDKEEAGIGRCRSKPMI